MARILVAGVPAFGLTNPVLPLVKALVEAGHEVDFFCGEAFRPAAERVGARLIPFGFHLGGALTSPRQLIRHGRRLFGDMAAGMTALGPRYDVVVGAGMQPAFAQVQAAVRRPMVFFSAVFFQNARTLAHLADIAEGIPAPARRLMRGAGGRRALGALAGLGIFGSPVGDLVGLLGPKPGALNLTVASRYYQPFPDDFPDAVFLGPTPTLRVPDPGFPLDRLRAHDGPVVYGTLGTVFNGWTPFFRTLADAFAGTDALVVLTTGSADRLGAVGPVPDNVILRPFVPQADVLDHADVCFTHGGFGTATDAVTLGVPAVLTPMGADQFFNAYRLQELGAGIVLPKAEFDVGSVRAAAERARAARTSEGAAALRASFIEAGGPQEGVRRIEALL